MASIFFDTSQCVREFWILNPGLGTFFIVAVSDLSFFSGSCCPFGFFSAVKIL
jgi:hypothetical protein